MRSSAVVRLALVVCLAAVPFSGSVLAQAEERAKVMRFVTKFLRDSGAPTVNPAVSIRLFDLTGDGHAEALVIINSAQTCGARGCSAFALDLSRPEARSVGDFIAN